MSYAIRKDGKGWRSVDGIEDIGSDDVFSEYIPEKTNAQLKSEELSALQKEYKSNIQQCQLNWLSAIVSDGETEEYKKQIISEEITDIKSQYLIDVAAIKSKYGA